MDLASGDLRIYGSFAGVVDSVCRAPSFLSLTLAAKKRKTTTTTAVPGEREREAALPVDEAAGARYLQVRDRKDSPKHAIVCDLTFALLLDAALRSVPAVCSRA